MNGNISITEETKSSRHPLVNNSSRNIAVIQIATAQ